MFLFHFKKVKILVGQLSFEKTQIEHTNKNTKNTNVKNLHTSPQKTKKNCLTIFRNILLVLEQNVIKKKSVKKC